MFRRASEIADEGAEQAAQERLAADGGRYSSETPEPREPALNGSIEIGMVHTSRHDVYGGRGSGGSNLHTAETDAFGAERGWLGNPYPMSEDTVAERRRVIAAYLVAFLDKLDDDPEFRKRVHQLDGKRVACYCRGVTQDRRPENWCHLDVVDAYLGGDLTPVFDYLRAAEDDS